MNVSESVVVHFPARIESRAWTSSGVVVRVTSRTVRVKLTSGDEVTFDARSRGRWGSASDWDQQAVPFFHPADQSCDHCRKGKR